MAIQAVLVAMVIEDEWVIKEEADGVPGKENGGSAKGGRAWEAQHSLCMIWRCCSVARVVQAQVGWGRRTQGMGKRKEA